MTNLPLRRTKLFYSTMHNSRERERERGIKREREKREIEKREREEISDQLAIRRGESNKFVGIIFGMSKIDRTIFKTQK